MNQGIRSIVERARAGDQVAMALIVEARKQAKAGNARAAQSVKEIGSYIDDHPASSMAGDLSVDTNLEAQAALWKARKSSPQHFAIVVAKVAPVLRIWDLIVAMAHGPKLDSSAPLVEVAKIPGSKIAACVRRACQLQRLADPSVPISSYCRVTGSELGE